MFFVVSNLFTYRMLPIATLKVFVAFVMDLIGVLLSVSRKLVAQVVSLFFSNVPYCLQRLPSGRSAWRR